ncbi:hypothetical protein CHS0354_014224 [Potamilus streckersoni]|uniref:Uncharacterized protein n=1 Tax=Potamilus streckersoni TaxID=2493646 RepID=A0AAE0SZQ9_9BIVA|nr:hypothetical protein CHS0354_014224 [Potamilus streckersoni]
MVGNSEYNREVQEECPTITKLTEEYINALTNDIMEIREILENERRNLDNYTELVYQKLVTLASHLSVVAELGMISSDIQVVYNKFGHALCKVEQFRTALSLDRLQSNICHYNGSVSLHSRAKKIGYSAVVLKQGTESLNNILLEIRDVVRSKTIGCKITCRPQMPKTLECRRD